MEQVVFLEGDGVDLATASGTLVRKQILPRNKSYRWPGQQGKTLVINDVVLKQVVDNFTKKVIDAVPFFKVNDRNGHTEDPEAARGVVVGLEMTDDGLDALIQPVDDAARKQILSTKLGASAGLNLAYKLHDSGENVGAVLRHVAWTPEPWIPGMRSFEEASLSGETFETIFLSAETDNAEEGGDNEMADITQEQIQAMIDESTAALSASLEQTRTELASANETINGLTESLAHREETATAESVEAELSALIQAGLPPAIAELARPVLMVGSTEVNLSADETSTIGSQVRTILKAFPKVDFRELGEGQIEGFVVLSAEDAKGLGYAAEGDDSGDDAAELTDDELGVQAILSTIPEDKLNTSAKEA